MDTCTTCLAVSSPAPMRGLQAPYLKAKRRCHLHATAIQT
ncbi:hypothetical protein HMPREF3190_00452 [Umbribacter vaginalis]|nr:hypothetical protein HMPREF3190_00452 [Coriobacteriales bacterium DNF00809]